MAGWIEGTLEPYWEQGMEGAFLYSLQLPDARAPFLLKQGDLLDLLSADGRLLWSGVFQLRKRRFWERHRLDSQVFSDSVLSGLSYQTWMAWNWSTPRLKARVLRDHEQAQIVYPWIDRKRNRPLRFRDAGVQRCQGRRVLRWSPSLGSYGMGGPGFFGLQLEGTESFAEEWMALTLWGACEWLLCDQRWLSAHPRYYDTQRPLYSNFSEQSWDELAPMLVGAVLESAEVQADHCELVFTQASRRHHLQLPSDKSCLPPHGGQDEARDWKSHDQLQDAWVFTARDLYC